MPKLKPEQAIAISTELSAKYFRALGDPTRLRILDLLIEGPLTVTEIVDMLACPQSRVSNHLACLRWCGFVTSEPDGRWITYSAGDPRIKKVITLVRELVSHNAQHVAACTRIAD